MNDLAEAARLYASANLSGAENRLKTILAADPSSLPARVMLGAIFAKSKRYSQAAEILESALADCPDQFDSLVWLAMAKKGMGHFEDAVGVAQRAVEAGPKDASGFNTLGLCYLAARQAESAAAAFRKAIALSPKSAAGYHNLGLALRLRDDPYEACRAFQKAIDLDPNNEDNYLQLYRQHLLISAFHDTILNLEAGLRRLPRSIAIQDALALSYCRTNQKEKGEALFKRIQKERPGFCHSYSLWLQEEGRFEESVSMLNRWLEIEPNQGMAYFCLAEAKSFSFSDGVSLIERGSEVLEQARLKPLDRMYLSYALGRANEQAKQYQDAMSHFDRANEFAFQIFNEGRRLDHDVTRDTDDGLMRFYSKETLAEWAPRGSDSEVPILIVGMIRSGTTLLNQILAGHPEVLSAGEQPFWKLEGARITPVWNASGIQTKQIEHLKNDYLAVLTGIAGDGPRIVDKMPLNYEMLGLIHIVFPRAKILHVRRNPVDTCLSIYCTHFGGGPNFAYKQENIVFHYREYLRLMEHWRSVLPEESFFELDYEELVADKEPIIREMIAFCGLPWDDACLHHDQAPSTVSTPSRWQARQPIYSTSVEKWKNYEPWLGRLLDLRDDLHPEPIRRRDRLRVRRRR